MCHNLAKIGVQGNAGPYFSVLFSLSSLPLLPIALLFLKQIFGGQTVLVLCASYQQRSASVVIVFHMNTNAQY